LKVLFIGDLVGKRGRWAISQFLPDFLENEKVDMVIANVENAAGGFGITENLSKKVRSYGVHVQTSGNHIWDRPELRPFLDRSEYILRPANYPVGLPGKGSTIYKLEDGRSVGVLNLEGRDFLSRIDCPFRVADAELTLMRRETNTIIVDFHAETVQEKEAMGFYLDGRVSAVLGTHTHVQTADEKILPGGTAYITDVGMSGAYDSVLGMSKKLALGRFITGIPLKFSVADNDVKIGGALIDINDQTGQAMNIQRIMKDISPRQDSEEIIQGEADGEDS
jgi:metallophosphoesterase (TIGR00282 family)